MEIRRSEIYRYLGYKRDAVDEQTKKLVEDCLAELEAKASPRFFGRSYPLALSGDSHVDLGCFSVESRNLYKNLAGCGEVYLFAATLGAGPDQLIARYSRLSMSRSVVMQAAAAAMIEAWCDEKNGELREQYKKQGYFLRPRFSPGYGDFSLEHQRDIARELDTARRLGLTVTDSLMLAPMKSVTAVIGVSRREGCTSSGCAACGKTDCEFRRQ